MSASSTYNGPSSLLLQAVLFSIVMPLAPRFIVLNFDCVISLLRSSCFRGYLLGLVVLSRRPLGKFVPHRVVRYLEDGVLSHHHGTPSNVRSKPGAAYDDASGHRWGVSGRLGMML